MRFLPVALLFAAFAALCFAQPSDSADVDIAAAAEREITSIREGLAKKREAVANAISNAAKAGHLKTSTEAYFRDVLEKFTAPEGALPDLESIYYPPRFDTSEEMEPINLAWSDLRQEVTSLRTRVHRLHTNLLKAATDRIQQSARALAKPESLDQIGRILAPINQVPDPASTRAHITMTAETVQRIATSIRAILDAYHNSDAAGLVGAFSRNSVGHSSFNFEFAGGGLPFRSDVLFEEMRARISAPLLEAAQEARRQVEKQIMADQSLAEVEKTLREFVAKATAVERLREGAPRMPSASDRSSIAGTYRAIAIIVETLRNDVAPDASLQVPAQFADGSYSMEPEFMGFVSKLGTRLAEHKRKVAARAEAERQGEQRRAAEQARAAEQKDKQEFDAELRKMIVARTKEVSAKILSLKSPEETLAFANEFTGGERFGDANASYGTPKGDLLQVGTWWLNAARAQSAELEPMSGFMERHPFMMEMKTLRDRAMRDVAAKQFQLPQLLEEPYAAMDVKAALDKVSQEAAAKGDWKQSYGILRVLVARDSPLNSPLHERLQAIRSYLTALNLETAEQYEEAAAAYLASIRAVGEHLPIVDAAVRLKKMRATHPEIFGPAKGAPKSRASSR